jgi:CxxC motif-containing protein
MQNKTCFVCGSFDHFAAYCDNNPWKKVTSRDTRVFGNKQPRVNNYVSNQTHSNVKIIPRSIVLNSSTRQFCPARQNKTMYPKPIVSCAKSKILNYKQVQTVNKAFFKKTARSNKKWVPKVSNTKPAVPTVRPKVPTDRQKKAVKGNMGNDMKATTQWVWRPITGDKTSMVLMKHTYIDARGRVKSVMAWVSNV